MEKFSKSKKRERKVGKKEGERKGEGEIKGRERERERKEDERKREEKGSRQEEIQKKRQWFYKVACTGLYPKGKYRLSLKNSCHVKLYSDYALSYYKLQARMFSC